MVESWRGSVVYADQAELRSRCCRLGGGRERIWIYDRGFARVRGRGREVKVFFQDVRA